MNSSVKRPAAIILTVYILLASFMLSSCGLLGQLIGDGYLTPVVISPTAGGPATPEASSPPSIPFSHIPEPVEYSLPAEDFADELEEEASGIIDGAIQTAAACVLTMRDDRHSTVSFPFDADSNGFISGLNETERSILDVITAAGESGSHFTVRDTDVGGNLKKYVFNLYSPLNYCYPDISGYLSYKEQIHIYGEGETYYSSMYDHYFDPLRDENCSVAEGRAEMEDVMHSARLLERVVGRIIRFMPEGLSTYDKYYYLAAVICACDSYSNKPENCFTAFGALISGKSVCEGYSKAFYLLCREADLWCAYRFGSSENGEGHIWNMIKLDSGIYNVDVTWCDNTENPCSYKWYSNFAISDSENYYTGHRPSSGPESTGEFEPSPYQYTP